VARCGLCGGGISNTIVPHGAICKDNKKAPTMGTCGDCLAPLAECIHGYYLRQEK
jgi:hypothetical protein